MTDGTGAYENLRTLLYYYCTERYGIILKEDGIRLAGDPIPEEEWVDPVEKAADLPVPPRTEMSRAINLVEAAGLQGDVQNTVYSIAIPESEFMRFNTDNDGSPGTMVSLFLSRAIAKMYPENKDAIRVVLCVNQRRALHAPLAYQSLVGGVMLEYKDRMKRWPLDRQATAYRGMVFAQTQEETVLAGVASQKGINQMLLSKETDQERIGLAFYISDTRNNASAVCPISCNPLSRIFPRIFPCIFTSCCAIMFSIENPATFRLLRNYILQWLDSPFCYVNAFLTFAAP